MKFNFRIQDYQTRAVESLVDVFKGQRNSSGIKYRIDPGTKIIIKNQQRKMEFDNKDKVFDDEVIELGFKNNELDLGKTEILNNIRSV